ncbi:SSI family serine proteinase inhibitor [Streptosporangium canum]|uniref:SSI family serine proteinase inhibitor n=1 Tax=Streptosporangium canum TaxID=324952 RepID=UPI00343593B7
MRRLLCLVASGLFLLSGTAAAAPPPPLPLGGSGPSVAEPGPPWSYRDWLSPDESAPGLPVPVRPIARRPAVGAKTFTLSIARGERPSPVAGRALLVCDPPQGTHPVAGEACEALNRVGGDPARLRPPPDLMCTMQYDPVTVTATGTWNNRYIRYERTFGNPCSLRGTTGPVFSF